MSGYSELKSAINRVIKTNNNREITGQILQNTLNSMVNSLGANYQFTGFATPEMEPGTPDQNIFYLTTQPGHYTNFGNIDLPSGLSFLMWKNNEWTNNTLNIYNEVSKEWVEANYVSKAFFNSLFKAEDSDGNAIVPNNTQSVIDRLKILVGAYTDQYLSALGLGPDGGGGASTLSGLNDVQLNNLQDGQALVYDLASNHWVNRTIQSGVDMSVVWAALAAATNEQINASHLTTALSGYVTATALATTLTDYITNTALATALSEYVTTTALATTLTDYITSTALAAALSGYVTTTALATTLTDYITSTALATTLTDYITSTALATTLANYVTTAALDTALANYVTTTVLGTTLANYVTTTALGTTLANYVTTTALTAALSGYVTTTALTTTLADYVTTTALATTLTDYAAKNWVEANYVSKAFFNRLFQAFNGSTAVNANDLTTTIDNIKAMFDFWSQGGITALGQGSQGGGGGGQGDVTWALLANNSDERQIALSHLTGALAGYALKSEIPSLSGYATQSWVSTNFALKSDIPTLATLSWSGYSSGSYNGSEAKTISIPSNTNQLTNGAGFITSSALSNYLPLGGGIMTGALTISVENWMNQLCLNRPNNGYNWGPTIVFQRDGVTDTVLGSISGHLFISRDGGNTTDTIWDSANDGSGSGLDADLLDGQHGSYYAAASSLNSYLPLSGGTMTGALHFANGTWNNVGDDIQMGDHNVAGALGLLGINGNTRIDFCQYGNSSNYKSIVFDGTMLSVDGNCNYATSAGNADTVDGEHANAFAHRGTANNLLTAGNEFNFISAGYSGDVWFNYQDENRQSAANISGYWFGNGRSGITTILHAGGYATPTNSSAYALTSDGGVAHIGSMNVHSSEILKITGYGYSCLTYYQTSEEFDGNNDWCHYIIANHGNGASYYHYTIGLPFWGVPKYRRQVGSTSNVTPWYSFITEENIGSQSVNYASSAGNADTLDGRHASSGDNKPWGTIPAITAAGWMDVGIQFEFHYDNTTGSDYSTVLRCTGNYSNIVDLPSSSGTLALTSQIPTNNNQLTNGAGYITSSGSCAYATSAGNTDTVDGYHASKTGGSDLAAYHTFSQSGATLSFFKIGTLPTVGDTGSGESYVIFELYNFINYSGNSPSKWVVTASSRASYFLNAVNVIGSDQIYVGYVIANNKMEIWVGTTRNYMGKSRVRVDSSSNFTGDFYKTTTKPDGWVDGTTSTTAYLTSNVASATQLHTSRSLWGNSFNGTADITGAIVFPSYTRQEGYSVSNISNALIQFGASGKTQSTNYTYYPWLSGSDYTIDYGYTNTVVIGSYHISYASCGLYFGFSWDGNNSDTFYYFSRDGWATFPYLSTSYTAYLCTSGGSVGIGTTSPSYKLHVAGDIYATGGVTSLSDARHKTIMGDTKLRVEQIADMPAITYKWNDGRDNDLHVGSIAQNWQRILPEVVSVANDLEGTLSINYGVAAMIASIVTAKKVVDHEARIKALESECERLREENKQLRLKIA